MGKAEEDQITPKKDALYENKKSRCQPVRNLHAYQSPVVRARGVPAIRWRSSPLPMVPETTYGKQPSCVLMSWTMRRFGARSTRLLFETPKSILSTAKLDGITLMTTSRPS